MKHVKYILTCITALLILNACASISLTGLYKMSQLSPLDIDPQQLKVAIIANKNIQINNGDVKISLGYEAEDKSLIIDDTYLVEVAVNAPITAELFDDKKLDENITLLALSQQDALQFIKVQQLVREKKQQEIKGQGSFGIGIDNFCLKRNIPKKDQTINLYIQTNVEDGFFIFLDDFDLSEVDEMNNNKTNSGELKSIMCEENTATINN